MDEPTLESVSVRVPATCPYCKRKHDMGFHVGSEGVGEAKYPERGDFICCVDCNGWGVYDPDVPGNVRKIEKDEQKVLSRLRGFQRIEAAIKEVDGAKDM